MLHWRPSEHNKYIFLLELIIISTLAHIIVGVLLFVAYKGGPSSFHIELGKIHSPTLFVPLKRPSMFTHAISSAQGGSSHRRKGAGLRGSHNSEFVEQVHQDIVENRPLFGSDTTIGFQPLQHDKKSKSIKKKNVARALSSKRRADHTKKEIKRQAKQAGNPKKIVAPINEPAKQVSEEQDQPKKIEPILKKLLSVPPLNNPMQGRQEPVEPIAPVVSQPIANQELPIADESSEQDLVDELPMDDIIIGAQGSVGEYVSAEQARMYECIEQEIVSRWKPPRGFSKDLVCEIKCCIGGDGKVSSCATEKSSGVLVYDMAARSATRAMCLPRWAWGKEFTIIFKQ